MVGWHDAFLARNEAISQFCHVRLTRLLKRFLQELGAYGAVCFSMFWGRSQRVHATNRQDPGLSSPRAAPQPEKTKLEHPSFIGD